MSGLINYLVEDRKVDAVAHLAKARTQNTGPTFWDIQKDKAAQHYMLRLFILYKIHNGIYNNQYKITRWEFK